MHLIRITMFTLYVHNISTKVPIHAARGRVEILAQFRAVIMMNAMSA